MLLNISHRINRLFSSNLVSVDDLCLGPKTVSLPVYQSNCIGDLKSTPKNNKKETLE